MNNILPSLQTAKYLVGRTTESGIPLPGFASSLFYFESMVEKQLPANMIQGLRDYFGAHTYERTDKEGTFHTNWAPSSHSE